ncbi:LacI family transcriptional regulator [Labedella gwakjiensis]|uniref:LacI family transcriptional regulator n=1 Tax=Labedella gwakjiensis TaxID=390269 RepID=A0A2P8GYY3_9MICO|nr:LacI family DNA-binding transcriptional regulator [Labedella gwakjiensis]PSL39167.1 LacI family transcriptional regulator [Labedella gwakjiensis]RUQ86398.1 LacI family transcriptional regulator [Labedella gwakjiensis]
MSPAETSPPERVRIKDVARAAGVSPATVSFVLNATAGQTIRPETADRVHRAADALGYSPHRIARALRSGSSRVVLLEAGALPRTAVLDSFIDGMDAELRRYDFALVVHHDRGNGAAPVDLARELAPRSVIDIAALYSDEADETEDGGWTDGLALHSSLQIAYLHEQGHRVIGFAARREDELGALVARRRRHAEEAAVRLGLHPLALLDLPADPLDIPAALVTFREENPEVTAVAAFDDESAIAVLSAAARLGVRVPTDMAVIGFDESAVGAFWSPPLTTVRIDAAESGRRTARLAIGLDPGPRRSSPSTIVVRGSA